jgi:nucleotide-binding universal stress UspA family protein
MRAPQTRQSSIDTAGSEEKSTALRSLLVATDLCDAAGHAVDRIARLAGQIGASATVAHVDRSWSAPAAARHPAPSRHEPDRSARQRLSVLARDLASTHGIVVRAESRRGDVCEQILAMSATADLLALSSKRRHPLHRFVFGSVAGRLLDRCRKPMLLVKRPAREPYRRVLILMDFSARSIEAAEFAAQIAPAAELHLFHAINLRDETDMRFAEVPDSLIRRQRVQRRAVAQARMDHTVGVLDAPAERLVRAFGYGDVAPLALLKQRALDSDLLVVAKQARRGTRSLRFWSTARRLSDNCACDVLVMPIRDDPVAA